MFIVLKFYPTANLISTSCRVIMWRPKMDNDLEQLLNDLWKKNPRVTVEYVNLKAKLLMVQELRKLNIKLSSVSL